jgi:hypothetical protein
MALTPPRISLPSALRTLARTSKIADIALPDSKGGETPKTLQTYRTEIYSYFTTPTDTSELMYSAENWVRIKLTLETAGPVAVGTSEQISPVLSGKGRLLNTDVEFEAYLAKGTRFYITSQTVNRISVTIEPVPWFEQISNEIIETAALVAKASRTAGESIVNAIFRLTGDAPPTSSSGQTMAQQPTPTLPRQMAARLTRVVAPRKIR